MKAIQITGSSLAVYLFTVALAHGAATIVTNIQKRAPATTNSTAKVPEAVTPRELYNAGTVQLRAGKLRDAEIFFERVLTRQNDHFQPPALYNLGEVRFNQGIEALKKGPAAKPTAARARNAVQAADEAMRQADDALGGTEVPKLVAAYMRGRGVRKELKEVTKAVQKALEAHNATLTKWQRSGGDFKSTLELKRIDADAKRNAEVVDRCIAKLVDSLRELQSVANAPGSKQGDLEEKLKQLKGRIPAKDMPPGAAGDDEDDDDDPFGPKPGETEAASKDGKEQKPLSQEQAGWLLDGFKLDTERRLPMGQEANAEPRDRSRPTW